MLVCITGQIGSGKTKALKYIQKCGYKTFCTDEYIHSIYKKGQIGYTLINQVFGNSVLGTNGVNRKELGKIVLSHKTQLAKLNKIMLPVIHKKIIELKKKKELCFIELGIFIKHKSFFANLFSKVIWISTNNDFKFITQKKRFQHIQKLPTFFVGKRKLPYKQNSNNTNFYVDNSSNLQNFYKKIDKILFEIKNSYIFNRQ